MPGLGSDEIGEPGGFKPPESEAEKKSRKEARERAKEERKRRAEIAGHVDDVWEVVFAQKNFGKFEKFEVLIVAKDLDEAIEEASAQRRREANGMSIGKIVGATHIGKVVLPDRLAPTRGEPNEPDE